MKQFNREGNNIVNRTILQLLDFMFKFFLFILYLSKMTINKKEINELCKWIYINITKKKLFIF